MSNTPLATASAGRGSAVRPFVRHYLEMVVAMFIGMIALHPVWSWLFDRADQADILARSDVMAMVMATNMTIAMSAWMAYRGHSWKPIAEMAAAMYLPFVVLLPPLWAGLISGDTLITAGHVLMLPAMAGVMLLRPEEYTHGHHHAKHH